MSTIWWSSKFIVVIFLNKWLFISLEEGNSKNKKNESLWLSILETTTTIYGHDTTIYGHGNENDEESYKQKHKQTKKDFWQEIDVFILSYFDNQSLTHPYSFSMQIQQWQ